MKKKKKKKYSKLKQTRAARRKAQIKETGGDNTYRFATKIQKSGKEYDRKQGKRVDREDDPLPYAS